MGYLINPIGFRVGQTREWQDIWFCYKKNYPEFLFFILKVRVVLNAIFNSFPTLDDLDPVKKDKYSLFNNSLLYSHYKISFNLHTVFIAFFLYPGKFWDSLMDKPDTLRKFSGAFARSMYWKNVAQNKVYGRLGFDENLSFLSVLRLGQNAPFREFFFKPVSPRALKRVYKKNKRKSDSYMTVGSNLLNLENTLYHNRFKIKDKRWITYNNILRSFFWDFKRGFHFLLIFFLFFKPFNIFYNFKSFLFKTSVHFFKQFNFFKNFNFYFFKKINSLYNFNLCKILSTNFLLYFNWGFFNYNFFNVVRTFFLNYKKFLLFNNRFNFYFKRGSVIFSNYKEVLEVKFFDKISINQERREEIYESRMNYKDKYKYNFKNKLYNRNKFYFKNVSKLFFNHNINSWKFGNLYSPYFHYSYSFKTFFPVFLRRNFFYSYVFYFKRFFSLFKFFSEKKFKLNFFFFYFFKKLNVYSFSIYINFLKKLKLCENLSSLVFSVDDDVKFFFWTFYKNFYLTEEILTSEFYKNFFHSSNIFDFFFFKRESLEKKNQKILLKRDYNFFSFNFYIRNFEYLKFKFFHLSNFFLFFNDLTNYGKVFRNKFNSIFLRKSRLFFFFNYFYRRKHMLLLLYKKHSLYSNFLYKLNNVKQKFLDQNLKSVFLRSKFSLSSFFFFLIWLFNSKKYRRKPFWRNLVYEKVSDVEEEDWLANQFARRLRYRQRWRFRKIRKRFKTFFGRFFKNFLTINWDFIISYLINKFFFKFNVDIKYFLIFIFFFKDLTTSDFFSWCGTDVISIERPMSWILKFMSIYKNETDSNEYDLSLEPILYRLMPFDNIKTARYVIDNSTVTALFVAKYFAIRLSTGHTPGMLFGPVAKSLSSFAADAIGLKKSNYVDRFGVYKFLSFRLYYFKKFVFKNFLLYKFLTIRFFKLKFTFFNFYLLFYFIFFFFSICKIKFLIGLAKSFFFRKHVFNFFFNYEFNIFLEKIFSFFSLVLLNFSFSTSFFFDNIFDDLFSNFNLIFFNYDYFNIDLSSIKIANYFFNQIIIYNYWFVNMTWLKNANNLNDLRARMFPIESFGGSIFGFKFHFRGRFSRRQRAGSFVYYCGNVPLTTLSADIDYGFVTVPLDNSLVSVRVWIFKNSFLKDIYIYKMSDFILIKNPSISNRFFYKQMLQKRGKEKKNNVTSIYKRSARLFYNRLFYKRKKWKRFKNRLWVFSKPAMNLSFFYGFYSRFKNTLLDLGEFNENPLTSYYEPKALRKVDRYNKYRKSILLSFFFRYIKNKRLDSFYKFYRNKKTWKKKLLIEIENRKKSGLINYPPYNFILRNIKPRRKITYMSKITFLGCYNTKTGLPELFYPKWYGLKQFKQSRNFQSYKSIFKKAFISHSKLRQKVAKQVIGYEVKDKYSAFFNYYKHNSFFPIIFNTLNKKKLI